MHVHLRGLLVNVRGLNPRELLEAYHPKHPVKDQDGHPPPHPRPPGVKERYEKLLASVHEFEKNFQCVAQPP